MQNFLRTWGWVLGVFCLAWSIWLVFDALPEIGAALRNSTPSAFATAVVATMAGAWLVFEAWRGLARPIVDTRIPRQVAAHMYFTGQILKYMPGRVWGLGYQALAGSSIAPAAAWLLTSTIHFGLAVVALVSTALVVFASTIGFAWGASAAVFTVVGLAAAWAFVDSRVAARIVATASHRRLATMRVAWPRIVATSRGDRARVVGLLLAGSIVGLLAWIPLCASGPWGLPARDALTLGAVYAIAWLAGYLAVFTPAGLGVRELVFVALAPQFGTEVVATMAVLGRANLLLADIALAAPFALVRTTSH